MSHNPSDTHIAFAVINDLTYDQRMIRICSSLVNEGYQVTLIGRVLTSSQNIQNQSYNQLRLRCWFNKGPLFYLEYNFRLFWHFMRSKYDVFCACDLDTAAAIHLAGRLKKRPRIYDAHEYFTQVPELINRPTKQRIWKWVGNWTIPKFDVRYTVNRPLADELARLYNCEFGVVMNCPVRMPIKLRSTEQADNPAVLLYQGALNVGRGIEQMIEAMQRIDRAELWIVGEGDISSLCRKLVVDFGVSNKVKFLGRVEPSELYAITQNATIGLNLLDGNSLNYYYSLANKFFDYMHAGVPSVNMNFPCYNEILSQHPVGITIESLDPVHLADVLNVLLADQNGLKQMNNACILASERYQWANEIGTLTKLISSIKTN